MNYIRRICYVCNSMRLLMMDTMDHWIGPALDMMLAVGTVALEGNYIDSGRDHQQELRTPPMPERACTRKRKVAIHRSSCIVTDSQYDVFSSSGMLKCTRSLRDEWKRWHPKTKT